MSDIPSEPNILVSAGATLADTVKPGYLTTEFWTTVIFQVVTSVVALAALFGHNLDGSSFQPFVGVGALLAAGIAQAVYSHSRGKVKAAASSTSTTALGSGATLIKNEN